jgi:hypothetical protein
LNLCYFRKKILISGKDIIYPEKFLVFRKKCGISGKLFLVCPEHFFEMRQRDDENINTYANESIQKRLLVETSLTFEKALKLAVAMETAM